MRSLTSLLAALMVAGCSTPHTVEVPVVVTPPAILLASCPEPSERPRTNEQLASYAVALRTGLRACNADKAALRAWAQEAKGTD